MKWRWRGSLPQKRLKKQEKAAENEENKRKAQYLGKWLGRLFWLNIAVSIILNAASFIMPPAASLAENAVSSDKALLSSLFWCLWRFFCGGVLLCLSNVCAKYKPAGICRIALGLFNLFTAFLGNGLLPEGWRDVLLFFRSILSLADTLLEISAHSAAVREIDAPLAEKWQRLWRWILIASIGSDIPMHLMEPVNSALKTTESPALGFTLLFLFAIMTILMLACAVLWIVMTIKKWIYWYKTAKSCREFGSALK